MSLHKNYTQLKPPHDYPRMTPNIFHAASADDGLLRWFFREISQPEIAAPTEGYIYLPKSYIFDCRYVLDENFRWVEETLSDWGVTAEAKTWIQQDVRSRDTQPANEPGGDSHYVMFFQCNSENYGHFLCEAGPKIMHMARAGLKKVKYLLPENCQRYRGITERLLAHVGIAAEAIPIGDGSTVCYRDILYFTAVSKHNFRKSETLLEFRDAALSLLGEPDQTRQKLFITRAPTDRRRVTNQDEIAALLSERGFRPIYPGTMTVEEQVRLFSSADHLVGSVGAGMSNMLFCPTGANIFYICNGLIDLFFWDIAGLCGQKFSWFFAQPPKAFDQQTFIANYPVDAAAFIAAWQRTIDIQKLPVAAKEHTET